MAETILFRLVAQDAGVNAAIVSNREEIKKLNKEIAASKGANGYADLVRNLTDAKVKAAELKAEQRALNREFQATQVPKDSLAGLRLEYSKLTEQITKLSAAERNSDFGKGLVSSAAKIKKEVDGIEQSVGRFTGNVGNYKSALTGVFGLFAAAGVSFGVGEIIQAARETEKLFAVLTNAVGSKSGATRIFSELQDFAATTPFALNEVVGAFTKLEQRNFNPNIEQLRTLGDIAAASGKSLDQFVEAVLDAQTGEFERLKEFGIVARKNGDQLSVSFKGQKTSIDNTSESITEYLLGLGKLPGIQGATDAVAKTLDGSLSNLADNFSRLFATIGSGGGFLQGFIDGLGSIVGEITEASEKLFDFNAATTGASQANDILSESFQKAAGEIEKDSIATERNFNILRDGRATQEQRKGAINDLVELYPSLLTQQQLESANIEQLNGLQVLSTNVLRTQITERLKLRAKEQIESEIVQKKLRQVELDATPDRALLGSLTAGETIRNFGVLNPTKLRSNIKSQFDKDISELESSLKRVDRNFAALQRSGEGNLSAAQQDALDTFRQFSEGGKSAADGVKKTEEEKRIAEEKEKKRLKELAEAAGKSGKEQANAYELVKKRIDELSESLQVAVTTNNQGAIPKILGDLTKAQTELQIIDATVARIKSGATNENRSIAQRVRNPLSDTAPALGSDLGGDPVSNELDRAKFANAEIVDDKERTNQELLQLQSELSDGNLAVLKKGLDDEKAAKEQAIQDEIDKKKQIRDAAIDAAESIAGAILDVEKNRIESQKETAITALDEEYRKKIDAAQGNNVLQEKLQKELDSKKLAIEKKAAKQRQDLAVKEAIVQGALAVIKALATSNFAAAIAAGVATIAQIAIIKSQKFAKGGMVKFGTFGGKPHSQGGTKGQFDDGTQVEVEKDEVFAVVNKRNAPMLQKLSAVNAYGGHGTRFFEKGGALNFTPQIALPQQTALVQVLPSEATFSDAQSAQIGEIAGREMAKILAPVLQNSVALGINDSNRRLERENDLLTNRTV